jgi:MFS family permease
MAPTIPFIKSSFTTKITPNPLRYRLNPSLRKSILCPPLAVIPPLKPMEADGTLGCFPKASCALGQRASFWVAAAVVVHTLWTSAAPAMSYPLYAAEWHLTPTFTTAIYAVYPLAVVSTLILFGDMSDYIGRRKTMLLGLAASLVGVLFFAVAPTVSWIFVGRAFMGIGLGLSASPSAAALVELSPAGQANRAGAITTAAQSLGLALALLVGGALIEYAPLPARLNFWVLSVVIALVFAATWFLPHHTIGETAGSWRPKIPTVPRDLYRIFATSTVSVTTSYSLGAVMLSLGAQIAHDLIGSANHLVNAAALSLLAVTSGIVAASAKGLSSRFSMMVGGGVSIAGMGLLALSTYQHSLAIFLAAVAAGGVGSSLSFLGGLNLINANAPVQHRGGTLSAVLLIAYFMQGFIAQLLGVAATAWGLRVAVDLGSVAIALLGIAAILLATFCQKTLVGGARSRGGGAAG